MGDVLVAAQIYQPTLLIGEWSAPLTIAEPGQSPKMSATWTPVADQPARAPARAGAHFHRRGRSGFATFRCGRCGANGRGQARGNSRADGVRDVAAIGPVIDLAFKARQLSAAGIYPLVAQPTDADIDVTLRGMKDLAPKSWPERFREIQEANGKIEVKTARIAQSDWLATGSGALGLTAERLPRRRDPGYGRRPR